MKDCVFDTFENYQVFRKLASLKQAELSRTRRDGDVEQEEKTAATLRDLNRSMKAIADRIDAYAPNKPPRGYNSLKRTDDRIFLRCRYVLGLTMEQTAEEMHISRDTAYRIRRRIADSV